MAEFNVRGWKWKLWGVNGGRSCCISEAMNNGFILSYKTSNAKGFKESTWENDHIFILEWWQGQWWEDFIGKGAKIEKIIQRRLLPPCYCSTDGENKNVKVIQEVEVEGLCLIWCWQWIEGNVFSLAHKVNGDTINQIRD